MKIVFDLDEKLVKRARKAAKAEGVSLSAFVAEALRALLKERNLKLRKFKVDTDRRAEPDLLK